MRSVLLFVVSIPGIYFNPVLIVWFVTMLAKHGLIFSPIRAFNVMKPLSKAVLYGFVPDAILTNVITFSLGKSNLLVILPAVIGISFSAYMLHWELIINSANSRRTNIYVLNVGLIMTLSLGWCIFVMEKSLFV
ncbi:hypothetical protein SAMN04488527_11818 [Aliiroseovarius crassostreae]|uniref:Uncharacterized protein n=1 Tax=Aliiroseovarius crassostreae TaxID=154981 RepID=A0A0P7KEZ5_9RHOB|nr:hypothetical protein [Aliiroseovarius crassostreae]KPN62010.1 hypothetical protein AKJ29_05250 [Aliiroseovarius crassostreae]SFU80766.1 hypothetical protein SAMN04488527_11818 [Aliiroseovarius crassostreae]